MGMRNNIDKGDSGLRTPRVKTISEGANFGEKVISDWLRIVSNLPRLNIMLGSVSLWVSYL